MKEINKIVEKIIEQLEKKADLANAKYLKANSADGEKFWDAYEEGVRDSIETIKAMTFAIRPFYFSFGSWEEYPYQNTYIIVYAGALNEAIEKFRAIHPDVHKDTVNCSFFYTEEQWKQTSMAVKEPADVII